MSGTLGYLHQKKQSAVTSVRQNIIYSVGCFIYCVSMVVSLNLWHSIKCSCGSFVARYYFLGNKQFNNRLLALLAPEKWDDLIS